MSIDSIRATSISAFPVSHEEPVFVLTGSQLREIIASAVTEATTQLEARVEALEACHNDTPVTQKRPENPGQVVGDLEGKIQQLQSELEHNFEVTLTEVARDRQRLTALEEARVDAPPAPPGSKTAARIERLKQILKDRGGMSSFKALRRDLELKPNQFTALVNKLDKRVFIVTVNHRARDEKLLRLRAFT